MKTFVIAEAGANHNQNLKNNTFFSSKDKKLIIKENLVFKEISIKLFWYIGYMYKNNIPISKPFLVYIKKKWYLNFR